MIMNPRSTFLLLSFITIFFLSCKKENKDYRLFGVVYGAHNSAYLNGVNVAVKKQVVASGTYNNSFTTATSMVTSDDGEYALAWPRENFAALQLVCTKDQYITTTQDLDIGNFTTENFVNSNIAMHPESFISVHVNNVGASSPDDFFRYVFINAEFDCTCCDNDWREFDGTIDSTYQCRLYGDTWLKYVGEIITAELDTIIQDSIWCPAFSTVQLEFEY